MTGAPLSAAAPSLWNLAVYAAGWSTQLLRAGPLPRHPWRLLIRQRAREPLDERVGREPHAVRL